MSRLTWLENSRPKISVEVVSEGIQIQHIGTECRDGDYPTIFVEWYDRKPRIVIWADINEEEPTHIIDMSGALKSALKAEA